MTNAPADLLSLRSQLETLLGLPAVSLGIVGDARHAANGGYHEGKSDLQHAGVFGSDYSTRLTRDRNGCTESASAMDIGYGWRTGGNAAWLRWNNLLVSALHSNDPALSTIRATNYSPDGHTKLRTDRENGWRTESSSDTVDVHTHIEWYRDTEGKRQPALDRIVALVHQAIGGATAPGTPKPPATHPAPGPAVAFPLPSGYYFGPKDGPDSSVSGFYGRVFKGQTDRHWLEVWASQLARRGWSVGAGKTYLHRYGNNGEYGDEYRALTEAFQRDQGLDVDGRIGVHTWDAAFHNPVT